jgi:exosortase F-associated protein
MLQKIFKNKTSLLFVGVSFLGLILVRLYEGALFYDPFLNFFKSEFQGELLPNYDGFKLFLNLSWRYFLNTIFSIVIISQFFRERKNVIFVSWVYLLLFVVLSAIFFGLLYYQTSNYLVLFYVRRFLIQPLFLVLFIPALYYQKISK